VGPIDLVIFDLDGTLVDTSHDIAASTNHVRAWRGLAPVSREQVLEWIGDGVQRLLERALGPLLGDPQQALQRFRDHHREHLLDHAAPYPFVLQTLDALAPRRLVVLSNKPEPFCRLLLSGLGMTESFAAIYGAESFAEKKPSGIPVTACVQRHGSTPARALMVGDSVQDIVAGQTAGTCTAAVTYGFRAAAVLAEAGPDLMLDSLCELPRLISAP